MKICPKCKELYKSDCIICIECNRDLIELTPEFYSTKFRKQKLKEKKKIKFTIPYFMQFWDRYDWIKFCIELVIVVLMIFFLILALNYKPIIW